jgi:VWFA-related protein
MTDRVIRSAGRAATRVISRVSIVAAWTLLALTLAADQTTPPQTTFRAGVDIVDVDVSVLDRHRLPVAGLTAADFTVYEDGKARPIVAFTTVDLPSRVLAPAPWMDEIAPDVATNVFPPEGRLVVILFDRSISTTQRAVAVGIAEAVVTQLRPGDLGAVVYTTRGTPQNFTADRQRLLQAIRRPFATLPEGDDGNPAECFCGACSLEAIERVADAIRDVRQRRKVLFVIGSNISIHSSGTCSATLTPARKSALRALEAGNVTVHALDPSGLQTLAPVAAQPGLPPARPTMANLNRQGNLRTLPDHTGGRSALGNEPEREVADIFRETASYYVLGFQPASTTADGRFHEISVKVRRPDVTLQARRGYVAGRRNSEPKPSIPSRPVPAALTDAVSTAWPKTALDLQMQSVPFALPGLAEASVSVTVFVRPPLDRASNGAPSRPTLVTAPADATTAVLIGAFDRNGRALAERHQTVAVLGQPRPYEYEVHTQLALKPGRYEIRAAIDDGTLRSAGSVYGYVDVPSFARELVSLSGILLGWAPAGRPPAAPSADDLAPIVPTARREFAPTDQVTAFLRLHQGLGRALMPGYLVAQILNERDARVFQQELRLVPAQFGANRAMDYTLEVPIGRLEPGEYVLTIEVTHGNVKARRDARFAIRK